MKADHDRLRGTLITLAEVSWSAWRRVGLPDILDGRFPDPERVKRLIPASDDGASLELPSREWSGRVFLLPPARNDLACLLAVKWNFALDEVDRGRRDREDAGDSNSRTFRLFLMPTADVGKVAPTVIRFDEGEDHSGPWCFAHAQVCDDFGPYELWSPEDRWVSATLPRIPLASHNEGERGEPFPLRRGPAPLFVYLIAGLYGIRAEVTQKVLERLNHRDAWKVARLLGWNHE